MFLDNGSGGTKDFIKQVLGYEASHAVVKPMRVEA